MVPDGPPGVPKEWPALQPAGHHSLQSGEARSMQASHLLIFSSQKFAHMELFGCIAIVSLVLEWLLF